MLLGKGWEARTRATYTDALTFARNNGLPFVPSTPEPGARGAWAWRFSCPKLGADGRCTIYDDRPDLCRTYEPMSDGLCVHYQGSTVDGQPAGPPVVDNEAPWPSGEKA